MRLTLRQTLLFLAILLVLSNESIFRIAVNLLITAHVLASILRGWLTTCVNICLVHLSIQYQDELESLRQKTLVFIAPKVRAALAAAAPHVSHWVRDSPQYLCRLNTGLTEILTRTAERLPGEQDILAAQTWARIQKAAESFCSLVLRDVIVASG